MFYVYCSKCLFTHSIVVCIHRYDRNKIAAPASLDFTKIDRVNFAFFQTNPSGDIWGTDSWAE